MSGRIRRRLTYANVMATLALIVALGGTAAAGTALVTSNAQVASKTISGHHPPSGAHANLFPGSVAGTDLSAGLKASLRLHCPAGMLRGGDVCFEADTRTAAPFTDALTACQSAGRRLPTIAELAEVFENSSAPQEFEWTDSFYAGSSGFSVIGLSENGSRSISLAATNIEQSEIYRCVHAPTNS